MGYKVEDPLGAGPQKIPGIGVPEEINSFYPPYPHCPCQVGFQRVFELEGLCQTRFLTSPSMLLILR